MNSAIILIDLQREFFKQGRLLDHKDQLINHINSLTNYARANHLPVIWVTQEFKSDLSDAPIGANKPGLLIPIEGTEGSQLLEGLEIGDEELHLIKKRYSIFFKTNLDQILKELEVDNLIIGGVNTHACIRTSIIDAYQLDYPVIIASDCTDSYDKEHHDISMKYLTRNIAVAKTNQELFNYLNDKSDLL